MIKDKNGLSLTQKIMLSYDPQSKMALGQTGRRRVNLTQMIRNRPPKQAKKLPKGEKPPPIIKADYMFQVTSRQTKYKNFLPDTQSPAIGQYSPRYDQILGRKPAFKIREETKDYSGDERINQSLQQMVINQIKCSKFPKKIYELHKAQVENRSLDRIQASQDDMVLSGAGGSSPRKQYDDQSPTKAMENPALEDSLLSPNLLTDQQHIQSPRTTSNNLMKSTRLSIDLDDPMLKKQSHLEALYGKNVRDLSPNANKHANQSVSGTNKSLTRSQIDEITLFNQYLKNLPNIEFKKQPPKDSYLDKITGNVHHKRFDSFDNFPRIFSKNKKIIVNLDIGKLSGRDEFAKPQNTPLFYNVSYSQVAKRAPVAFMDTSGSGIPSYLKESRLNKTSIGFHTTGTSPTSHLAPQQGFFHHELFKPRIKFKRQGGSMQKAKYMMLDDN
ncbi:hypothetical protein FGO68_gene213 [Halteria grandinella]|uniref:Uncharacterized protein n=1 Tax=Halteria grandinella TaxID=5974 RepID=A0A8J8NF96_HALGN|nr:hypothetical protein FGO68_gene213 [Halteria grandinella]